MNKFMTILSAILPLGCLCTFGPEIAGTSEQGNARIVATVFTTEGFRANGATVRLRREDYYTDPVSDRHDSYRFVDTFTDSAGVFFIDSLDTGKYTIEVTNIKSAAALLKCEIPQDIKETIKFDSVAMQPFATVNGMVGNNRKWKFVQIQGLERLVEIDSSGNYAISDLPAGTFTLKKVSLDTSVESKIIQNVVTQPGQTTVVPIDDWLFSRPVYLNTTSSGADISKTLYNFPVLVRLGADNFEFNEALPDGADIRFLRSGSDSLYLPFEIEQWNSQALHAEIWVEVDTIYGDSLMESFIMLWGNTEAKNESSGQIVFDTTNGFGGVWHLSGSGEGQARDATRNKYNGVEYGVKASEGIIGGASLFSRLALSYVVIPNSASGKLNFPADGEYSIGAWVKADSVLDNRVIISKGENQYILKSYNQTWFFAEYHNEPSWGWQYSSSPITYDTWVHIYGVRNGASQYLYINGVCVDSSKTILSADTSRIETFDVEFGRRSLPNAEPWRYFDGSVDEIRMCTTPRSPEWIRLSYQNQRKDDRLVLFKSN